MTTHNPVGIDIDLEFDTTPFAEGYACDPFADMAGFISDIHEKSVLHQCAEEVILVFTGQENTFQFDLHERACDTPCKSPDLNDAERDGWITSQDWLQYVENVCIPKITEPVRHIHMHFRVPDFSVHSMVAEAEGYVHTQITIPALGHPGFTPFSVIPPAQDVLHKICQMCWGKFWAPIPCNHNKGGDAQEE